VRTVQLLDGTPPRLRIELQRPHFAGVRASASRGSWCRSSSSSRGCASWRLPRPRRARTRSAEFPRLLASIKDSGPGTGPYMIGQDEQGRSTWRKGQDLRLVRNPLCWRRSAASGSWNFEASGCCSRAIRRWPTPS